MRSGGIIIAPLFILSFVIWYLLAYHILRMLNQPFTAGENINKLGAAYLSGTSIRSLDVYKNMRGVELMFVDGLSEVGRDDLGSGIERSYQRCVDYIRSDNRFIRTLINVAPLLGLLGTVMGMVETFRVIGVVGTSEPKLLARGISFAMITTQVGLLIAVPAIFIEGRARRLERQVLYRLEETKLGLLRLLGQLDQQKP